MTYARSAGLPRHPALIADRRVATAEWFPSLDPSNGRPFALVARCGSAEITQAVEAARHTYERTWRRTSAAERGAVCRAVARAVRAERGPLAELESLDTGKPISQALVDVDVAARYFDFYGGTVEALSGETVLAQPDLLAFTVREPYGVCGHIIPWNYPLQVAARTIAPALATGNCCVLKPAEEASLSSLRLGELALEAGLPAGALNVVPGLGEEAGAALTGHPDVDHLAFTGSREVGELVMAAAARSIVPVTLELGGKSPHIVFPDFDIERALPLITGSITEHAGQNCSAGSRLIIHASVHDKVLSRLADAFRSLRIGPGATDPDMGPLISAKQRARVLAYMEQGKEDCRLITGGGTPQGSRYGQGFYVEPTILAEVTAKHTVFNEEIFGPVLCVSSFETLDEAVHLAESTSYGLSAGVWTRDLATAHHIAGELRVGQVFVNNYSAAGGVELPFGGYKRSGIGVEKGFEALREYSRCKTIAIRTALT